MVLCLIAANFLREQRWPLLLLLAWIVLTAVLAGGFGTQRAEPADVVFYAQQQALYICFFCAFLAASAVHNERKSRRILLVLSKAVSRAEYLLAVLASTLTAAIFYAIIFAGCCMWLAKRAAFPTERIWMLAIIVIAGAAITAALALFFSAFLNPYLAMALTIVVIGAPALVHPQQQPWLVWFPGLALLLNLWRFSFFGEWSANWPAIVISLVEAALLWRLAAFVFARRDIAVPVE